ncbi:MULTISPECIES: hypothetical protein [Ralstonia solanacearum species complex]|uniref:Lipoprotein n=3 Tax=Ralstonia solanacearum TaxID=305 RepID=A0ABF7RFA9_RALSL|nr:hypothetical protein [Ralstonia solanacearum]ALF87216.1 hypothetical protein RSUY_08390 [Ralstonia solanacearum]ATI26757.1 hypothetical protein CCY86_04185 [Ralstonia solanacearum]EAP71555.1 Hypothetical Protein RRSL_01234 [Ralstonia solanacearum UW551]EUJ15874.1 hypothetical protein RSP673_03885 [Ralstonia solanacearum P673]KEI33654.1 hypothetical protein CQ06_08910 [Ralstonia solanacearum]
MNRPLFLALLAAITLAGCGRSDESGKAGAPAPASAPAATAPASAPAAPAAVSDADQAKAIDLAVAAIQKYKLTSLSPDCLSFIVDQEDATHNSVEVLENHTPACGGDPATAPRVVTLLIDRNTGALQSDKDSPGAFTPLK